VSTGPPGPAANRPFYVTGGTLQGDAASYVVRQADYDLYGGLRAGNFCYVLTPRQMGKSSLMVRTAARLREQGATVVVLDLTAIGQNVTPEQWYDGLLNRIGQQVGLEEELESFWLANARVGPLQRWTRALREVVLPRISGRAVLFIDEIDAVRSLPFPTDEFFAGIREYYNRRSEDPELNRLTFCLLGVAAPSDLIRDPQRTPFNIGDRVELKDFGEVEARPLATGLGRPAPVSEVLLKRTLYWTSGHPYLTQQLCLAVSRDMSIMEPAGVDRACEGLFLTTRARERDDNLLFVRERILRSAEHLAGLLDLYAKVHDQQPVRDDDAKPLVSLLHLSGIVRVADGHLRVRNRIYYRVFDVEWIRANRPDVELRRQRDAYGRGLTRAAGTAVAPTPLRRALVPAEVIGGPGREAGEFNSPHGLAVDVWGNLYVADTLNHRVQKITPSQDVFLYADSGRQPGQLLYPTDIVVDPALFTYVLDAGNARVQKFHPTWQFISMFGLRGTQSGSFRSPNAIARDNHDSVYVADTGNGRVQKFDARGRFALLFPVPSAGSPPLRPTAVAIDRLDSIHVADAASHRIVIFNRHGAVIGAIGRPGAGPGELSEPAGLAIGPDGTIFVSDLRNARLQAFSPAGECLAMVSQDLAAGVEIGEPRGLAVDAEGNLYVADSKLHRVTKFSWR